MSEVKKKDAGSYLPDIHRLLPQNSDAEKSVIGSMLLNREAIETCNAKGVSAKWFHIPAHAQIAEEIIAMHDTRKPVDMITLVDHLRNRKILDQCGGPAFIAEICAFTPTAANVGYYINILEEKYTLRQMIDTCTEVAGRSYDEQGEVTSLLDELQEKVMAIAARRYHITDEDEPGSKVILRVLDRMEEMYDTKAISGIPTGFPDLDQMIDGLRAPNMFVIAARPSMGKTSLAMNIAEHVAISANLPVAVFSLEMDKADLVQRMILGKSRVSWEKWRNGMCPPRSRDDVAKAAIELAKAPIYYHDRSPVKMNYLAAILRRWVKRYGIRLGVIDYLQLVRGMKNYKGDNRQAEVAEVSAGLKSLAKELNIPIIVLAQLNRNPDARNGSVKGRPQLSDLRDSGSIEQDADIVGLLHREEYYAENDEEKRESEGRATLIIAKQRNGPTGDIPLTFIKEYTRFESRAHPIPEETARIDIPKMGGRRFRRSASRSV